MNNEIKDLPETRRNTLKAHIIDAVYSFLIVACVVMILSVEDWIDKIL